MSKIAITPNASGTGTFTIAAPNSNTDRTLTLPDAAGAVVIDEAGGGSVKIDSNGNMGIGTSNPATTLDVSDVSRYTFNVSNAYTLQTSLNPAGSAFADDYKNAAQHIWQTSGTERMRIDSAGRVTMPYQPMFSAGGNAGGTVWSGSVIVPFNTAALNVGNHYNTSTYTFTAPVAGVYFFSASVLNFPSASSGYITLHFSVNGSGYTGAIPMSRKPCSSQETIQVSGLIKLNANDTVAARLADNSGEYYTASGHAHFDGMLIG